MCVFVCVRILKMSSLFEVSFCRLSVVCLFLCVFMCVCDFENPRLLAFFWGGCFLLYVCVMCVWCDFENSKFDYCAWVSVCVVCLFVCVRC